MKKILMLLASVAILLPSCSTFNLISLDQEKEMGQSMKLQVVNDKGNYPILPRSANPQAYAHIDRIFKSIVNCGIVNYTDYFDWEISIIDSDVQNAFACPGGKVYVYRGLIEFLDTEAELAGVLAHEIGHVSCRHSTQQLTKQYGVSMLLNVANTSVFKGSELGAMLGNIAGTGVIMSFSRTDEYEADRMAVDFLCRTSYNPLGLSGFFSKVIAAGESGSSGIQAFFSTHPSSPDRLAKIKEEWVKQGSRKGNDYKDRYSELKRCFRKR